MVDRIRALDWVLKFYRTGLELEEKLLPCLERDQRIERLKHLRNELRTRLSSGEGEPMALRKRMVEIAEEINRLESGN